MKKLGPVLLLLLMGCQDRESENGGQTVALQDDLLGNLGSASVTEDPARVQALVDRAMAAALPDGAKAEYRNVRAGVGGSACGEVSMAGQRGKPAPFRRFVVTPDAVAVVGTGPEIKFNDPSDFLADAWIRWCATPEELKLVETQIEQGPALASDPLPATDLPPPIEEPLPPPPREMLPRRTASAPTAPPPPAQIDSFAKSVSRAE